MGSRGSSHGLKTIEEGKTIEREIMYRYEPCCCAPGKRNFLLATERNTKWDGRTSRGEEEEDEEAKVTRALTISNAMVPLPGMVLYCFLLLLPATRY